MIRELIDRKSRRGAGVLDIAIGPAAGEEQQQAVNRDAAARTQRAAPAQTGLIDGSRGAWLAVAALDAGPEAVSLDTEEIVAALPVVADLAAADRRPSNRS